MRFKAKFSFSDNFIPFNYRRHFLSLIKEAFSISNPEFYKKYYENKKKNAIKPFTFSVSFIPSKNQPEKGKIFLDSKIVNFYFSSYSYEDLIILYNGFNRFKRNELHFFNNKIKLINISYIKQKNITENKITFKTLSPIIVRELKDKKGKGFLTASHPDFTKNLFYNVRTLCRNFLKKEIKEEDFKIVSFQFTSKKITLYGDEIGNKGTITIIAPTNILKLIYDAGLGAKRSQGFGMLEVIGQ